MKKLFTIDWHTNYGLCYIVISADTKEEAKEIATHNGAWSPMEITEIGITNTSVNAIIHRAES